MMAGEDVHQSPALAGGRYTRRSLQLATGGARAWYADGNEAGGGGADSRAISAPGAGWGTARFECDASGNDWPAARIWQVGQVQWWSGSSRDPFAAAACSAVAWTPSSTARSSGSDACTASANAASTVAVRPPSDFPRSIIKGSTVGQPVVSRATLAITLVTDRHRVRSGAFEPPLARTRQHASAQSYHTC